MGDLGAQSMSNISGADASLRRAVDLNAARLAALEGREHASDKGGSCLFKVVIAALAFILFVAFLNSATCRARVQRYALLAKARVEEVVETVKNDLNDLNANDKPRAWHAPNNNNAKAADAAFGIGNINVAPGLSTKTVEGLKAQNANFARASKLAQGQKVDVEDKSALRETYFGAASSSAPDTTRSIRPRKTMTQMQMQPCNDTISKVYTQSLPRAGDEHIKKQQNNSEVAASMEFGAVDVNRNEGCPVPVPMSDMNIATLSNDGPSMAKFEYSYK